VPQEPKLKGKQKQRNAPYPLGQIPHSIVVEIGKRIVHRLVVGQANIIGDDFGEIFAQSINGDHRKKPLGLADVTWEGCAWSMKTVQDKNPFTQTRIRAISGRNNVNYSFGIKDPYADIPKTGESILKIWNGRINQALNEYEELRILIMIRNMDSLEFTIMELEAPQYIPSEYYWEKNKGGNLEGFDHQRKEHRFTWQTTAQFTVIHHVPTSAYRFRINRKPMILQQHHVLQWAKYEDSWIEPVTVAEKGSVVPVPPPCAPSI
jgi:hypothetical protein